VGFEPTVTLPPQWFSRPLIVIPPDPAQSRRDWFPHVDAPFPSHAGRGGTARDCAACPHLVPTPRGPPGSAEVSPIPNPRPNPGGPSDERHPPDAHELLDALAAGQPIPSYIRPARPSSRQHHHRRRDRGLTHRCGSDRVTLLAWAGKREKPPASRSTLINHRRICSPDCPHPKRRDLHRAWSAVKIPVKVHRFP